MKRSRQALPVVVCVALSASVNAEETSPAAALSELIQRAGDVKIETLSASEYQSAATSYRGILEELQGLDLDELEGDDVVDADLLAAHLKTRAYEIEELRLYQLIPVGYLVLGKTDNLAEQEERETLAQMQELAQRVHPSGVPTTVPPSAAASRVTTSSPPWRIS